MKWPSPPEIERIPEVIRNIVVGQDHTYIVGGAARWLMMPNDLDFANVKDWDIVCESKTHMRVLADAITKKGAPKQSGIFFDELSCFQSFEFSGGSLPDSIKLKTHFGDFDLWVNNNIGDYLAKVPTGNDGIAFNPRTGTYLTTKEFWEPNRLITTRPTIRFEKHGTFATHLERQGLEINNV